MNTVIKLRLIVRLEKFIAFIETSMTMESEEKAILEKMTKKIVGEWLNSVKEMTCPKGILHVNSKDFDELLRKCDIVLVDFWAEWCGPCRMIEPIVESLAVKYASKVAIAKVNVDENSEAAFEYGVMSIPTLVIFYKGKEYKRFVGYYPALARDLDYALKTLVS